MDKSYNPGRVKDNFREKCGRVPPKSWSWSMLEHISENLLDSYAFGELDAGSVAAIEEHLLICEHCRTRLDQHVVLLENAGKVWDERQENFPRTAHIRFLWRIGKSVTS
jgi:Putative zinc-finger